MSGIHDPHTLREESQWPDPFSFQIPSGPSVKVTEKPMKRAGPAPSPAQPAMRVAVSVPESGPGWS